MTLRFFRRKQAETTAPPDEPATEPQPTTDRIPKASAEASDTPRRTRSRGRTGATARTTQAAKDTQAKDSTAKDTQAKDSTAKDTPAKRTQPSSRSSSSRGGRGRRGGASRKPAPQSDGGAQAVGEPAPVTPLRAESATLIDVFAQQQALLEKLTERQLTALKGLQGSLSAIENRLGEMDRVTPGAAGQTRVGIFVDVPNVMYAAERLGVKIDFGKMLTLLVRGRELARASAYAPISDDPMARLETQRFVQPFVGLGYRIVTKPLKRFADGSMKANFDVELAIDVLSMSDRLDTVTLVSGDGDFRRLVELVASKGVRVEVVAFGQSMAAELRAVADEYFDINDHLAELRVT